MDGGLKVFLLANFGCEKVFLLPNELRLFGGPEGARKHFGCEIWSRPLRLGQASVRLA